MRNKTRLERLEVEGKSRGPLVTPLSEDEVIRFLAFKESFVEYVRGCIRNGEEYPTFANELGARALLFRRLIERAIRLEKAAQREESQGQAWEEERELAVAATKKTSKDRRPPTSAAALSFVERRMVELDEQTRGEKFVGTTRMSDFEGDPVRLALRRRIAEGGLKEDPISDEETD